MKIECILKRRGGSHVEIDGIAYHFAPISLDIDAPHVATVQNEEHQARFLSITEGYRYFAVKDRKAVTSDPVPAPVPEYQPEPATADPAPEPKAKAKPAPKAKATPKQEADAKAAPATMTPEQEAEAKEIASELADLSDEALHDEYKKALNRPPLPTWPRETIINLIAKALARQPKD